MARDIDFSAFNNEQLLSKVQGVTDRLKELRSAVKDSNKELSAMELAIDNVQDNFREVNRVARNYNKLQSEAQKTSSSLKKIVTNRATIEQNIFSLNTRLNKLYQQQLDVEENIESLTKSKLSNLKKIQKAESIINELKEGYTAATKEEQIQLDSQIKIQNAIINNAKDTNTSLQQRLDINREIVNVTGNQGANLQSVRDEASLVLGVYKELENSTEQLNNRTGSFVNYISRILNDIPGLRQFTEPFEEGLVAYRKQLVINEQISDINLATGKGLSKQKIFELGLSEELTNENGKLLTGNAAASEIRKKGLTEALTQQSALTKGFSTMGTAITKSLLPLALISAAVKAISFFVGTIGEAQRRTVDLGRQFGVSSERAKAMKEELEAMNKSIGKSYVNVGRLIEAQTLLVKELDRGGKFNQDNLEAILLMTRRMGITEEVAAKIAARAEAFGYSSRENIDTILQMNNQLYNSGESTATFGQLMTAVSEASGQVAASFGFSNTAIARAVIGVRKLGLNLTQARNISENLLDFETSIGAELEAELFLGRDINLDRARALSMTGNIAGATGEVMKIMEGLTAEQRKSPIIMKALADVIGISVDELQDALQLQSDRARQAVEQRKNSKIFLREQAIGLKKISKLQEDLAVQAKKVQAAEASGNEKIIKHEVARRKAIENQIFAQRELIKERGNELGILDTKTSAMEDQATLQESLQDATEKVRDAFINLHNSGVIDSMTKMLMRLFGDASVIREQERFEKQAEIDRLGGGSKKFLAEDAAMMQDLKDLELEKIINQTTGALPGMGGYAFVKDLLLNKEIRAQQAEIISTKQMEVDRLEYKSAQNPDSSISVNDFTIKTHPKDSLVMAGGTQLGGGSGKVESLLERLVSAVEKGGDVYIDGNKAGRAMVLGTQNFS